MSYILMERGDVFDTEFESDCVFIEYTDELGNFVAYDSDSVRVAYGSSMVTRVYIN